MLTQKRSSKKYNIKELLKFEDYWAIILGFAILLCTLFVFSINYTKSIKADLPPAAAHLHSLVITLTNIIIKPSSAKKCLAGQFD